MLVDLAAGTAAGVSICLVGQPMDCIKVLMQTQPDKFRSMTGAFKDTIAKYGVAGLYKGVQAPLMGSAFYNAVQFAVFARVKNYFTDNGRNNDLSRIAAAAALTGLAVALVEGPQDVAKSQMQAMLIGNASGPKYTSTTDCAKTILKQRGIMGFTQGLGATMARNFVGVGAYFYGYEALRKWFAGDKPVESLSAWHVLTAGGAGGFLYWALSYPLDILKTAIQTDAIMPADRKYKGMTDAARKLWAEGGVKRFTAGLAPCMLRAVPANAAGFAAYEVTKKLLDGGASSAPQTEVA